jgi:hypothetical protein
VAVTPLARFGQGFSDAGAGVGISWRMAETKPSPLLVGGKELANRVSGPDGRGGRDRSDRSSAAANRPTAPSLSFDDSERQGSEGSPRVARRDDFLPERRYRHCGEFEVSKSKRDSDNRKTEKYP